MSPQNKSGFCPESKGNIKHICTLVLVFAVASCARAQQFGAAQPAGKERGALLAISLGLAGELASTARDFATFRDKQWTILTFAQIGAASANAQTSLYNLRHCASCREVGVTSFVVGGRPDAHKYIVAGLVEITAEAVLGHYLRNHVPVRKWYWRLIWTLPQSLSLYEHAHASMHNAGVNLGCDSAGQHCY